MLKRGLIFCPHVSNSSYLCGEGIFSGLCRVVPPLRFHKGLVMCDDLL